MTMLGSPFVPLRSVLKPRAVSSASTLVPLSPISVPRVVLGRVPYIGDLPR